MKITPLILLSATLLAGTARLTAGAASPSDINLPQKRVATVELAAKLAHQEEPAPLPPDLKPPFNPPGFDQADPEETKAKAAVAQANAEAAKPAGDHEVLEVLATRIVPSGTVILGGEPMLLFRQKKMRVGDHLTITYDGRDYDVVITAIDRTTFTLRLNRAEITRPIKSGKTP
ncbi:MAG: hypothetical protein HZA31_09675 [Opitutae bacterium]|nr:hypothetical protein [Opitutae bacterium]